jgi:hypothetical protein
VRTMPSMMVMPTPGQIAELDAFEDVLAGRVLRLVHEHEIGGTADFDDAAIGWHILRSNGSEYRWPTVDL